MRCRPNRRGLAGCVLVAGLAVATTAVPAGQRPAAPAAKPPVHAKQVQRLLITNAMVIYGNAKPAYGPVDILVQDGLIARVGRTPATEPPPDAVIDAAGKYVLPGLINTHIHLQDERGGVPQPFQYELNLYLAAGCTTVRDVGSDFEKAKQLRAASAAHALVAPRIQIYSTIWRRGNTPKEITEGVRWAKEQGVDGLKLFGMDRDQLEAVVTAARSLNLRTAIHMAVEEITVRDFADLGGTSIEHFYGIGDAALDGIQDFPPDHNANNEIHRFGRAGELYIQKNLNRQKLSDVLDLMIKNHVAWCPTMSIYEASRDVIRAQNLPWYKEYLHPTMEDYFRPDLRNHGSYFIGWTNTQEVRWGKDYQVWMDALREFGVKGGLITTGDDAGFIYSLYGFGLIRELELMEEAGFHPLEVIKHATVNGATLLGLEDRLGRVRQGYIADLLVVNGNPLENLRILNPYGADMNVNNRNVHGGGIEWTIKDGIPYHVPTLMKETKEMVARARAERAKKPPAGK
ncbi:MAG: amidohydrolase family protein [Planctomycetes bacterium]|nr:amidohydrolase family protein [Planctomycetota bacterium]